jgi:hypothetical protein
VLKLFGEQCVGKTRDCGKGLALFEAEGVGVIEDGGDAALFGERGDGNW